MGRGYRRRRQRPRRARRQRRRPVGARGRPDGRPGAARPGHGAHLPVDPGHAGGRRARRADRPRDAHDARLRWRDLPPPGGRVHAHGDLRAGVRAVVAQGDPVGLRDAAPEAGHGPHHAGAPGGVQALPGDGHDRHPQGRQRPIHVLARWEPAGRPHSRPARLLGSVWRDGRSVAGRWRGPGLGDVDDVRRPRRFGDGYLGYGRGPLRRLRHAGLHQRQGPGELPTPVPDHLPQRGAAWRPPAADHTNPRPVDRGQRGLGRVVRPGARPLVPGAGAAARGGGHVPPVQCLVAGRRRGRGRSRAGRVDRDLQLRQVPGDRAGRRNLAVVPADGTDAGPWPDHPDRYAQRGRSDRRRVHRRADR